MADDLLSNLKVSSKKWATAITKEAKRNLGKKNDLIGVSSETVVEGDKLRIVTTGINKAEDPKYGIKNVARAYEYGSGIRSRSVKTSPKQQGSKGKILIEAKRKKFLAFFWEKAIADPRKSLFVDNKKIYRGGEDDIPPKARILLGSVLHPGVRAANSGKGYIKPAVDKVRAQIRKEIPSDIRKAVLGNFRKSFKDAK